MPRLSWWLISLPTCFLVHCLCRFNILFIMRHQLLNPHPGGRMEICPRKAQVPKRTESFVLKELNNWVSHSEIYIGVKYMEEEGILRHLPISSCGWWCTRIPTSHSSGWLAMTICYLLMPVNLTEKRPLEGNRKIWHIKCTNKTSYFSQSHGSCQF